MVSPQRRRHPPLRVARIVICHGHVCNASGGSIKVTAEQIEVALRKIQGNTQEREFIQVILADSRGSIDCLHMHLSLRACAAFTTQ